jgi:hypothetical protein
MILSAPHARCQPSAMSRSRRQQVEDSLRLDHDLVANALPLARVQNAVDHRPPDARHP